MSYSLSPRILSEYYKTWVIIWIKADIVIINHLNNQYCRSLNEGRIIIIQSGGGEVMAFLNL